MAVEPAAMESSTQATKIATQPSATMKARAIVELSSRPRDVIKDQRRCSIENVKKGPKSHAIQTGPILFIVA
jgi:hypothetical protein